MGEPINPNSFLDTTRLHRWLSYSAPLALRILTVAEIGLVKDSGTRFLRGEAIPLYVVRRCPTTGDRNVSFAVRTIVTKALRLPAPYYLSPHVT